MSTVLAPQHQGAGQPPPAARPPAVAAAALSLALKEVRSMLRSPVMFFFLVLPFVSWPFETVPHLKGTGVEAGFRSVFVSTAALIYFNLAVLRPRRHGTEEICAPTPLPPVSRTAGHVLSVAGVFALAWLIPIGLVAFARLRLNGYGDVSIADLAAAPLSVAFSAMLGILVARLVASPIAGVLAGVALVMFRAAASPLSPEWDLRWLNLTVSAADVHLDALPPGPYAAHALYLIGLVLLLALLALATHGVNRRLAGLTALVTVTAAGLGFYQVLPRPQEWAAVNDRYLVHPEKNMVCEARSGIRYCAFEQHRPLIDLWAGSVQGVLRSVPVPAQPADIKVVQRLSLYELRYAAPKPLRIVTEKLPGLKEPVPAHIRGAVDVPMEWALNGSDSFRLALGIASRTAGLAEPLKPGEACDASGQARAAIALWLAGQSSEKAAEILREDVPESLVSMEGRSYLLAGMPAHEMPLADIPVAFGSAEVAEALRLLEAPESRVQALLAAEWARFMDPATRTDELAARLGHAAPTPLPATWKPRDPAQPGGDSPPSPIEGLRIAGPCL